MSDIKNLSVKYDVNEPPYDIFIGSGILADAKEYILPHLKRKKVFIVTDENVAQKHLITLQKSLDDNNIKHVTKILPAGEQSKSFQTLETLTNWMLERKIERKSTVLALGGGVIGDLTGFAASIVLRGVDFIQIPTTVLSQVDSSVGGKTAINCSVGKNLIGSFYQPKVVLIDTDTISTLPKRQIMSGYGEIIKYGLIGYPKFFQWLQQYKERVIALKQPAITTSIYYSCTVKADIVSKDEKEQGVRALLNLGHTFAHAYEAETGFSDKLFHGEAVALGILAAFLLAIKLDRATQKDLNILLEHYRAVGLPIDASKYIAKWQPKKLLEHMRLDKKVDDGKLVFILPTGLEKAEIVKDVPEDTVLQVLEEIPEVLK